MTMTIRTLLLHITVTLWLATCAGSLSTHSRVFLSAREGTSVVLPCDWRNVSSPSPHIEWRTISETVFERRGEEHYQSEDYKDRVDVPEEKLQEGNCSLVLKDVRPADAGVYESYLLVRRTKRALQSKRVFIQSVELTVNEPTEESSGELLPAADDAGVNCSHLQILTFFLLSWVLFFVF